MHVLLLLLSVLIVLLSVLILLLSVLIVLLLLLLFSGNLIAIICSHYVRSPLAGSNSLEWIDTPKNTRLHVSLHGYVQLYIYIYIYYNMYQVYILCMRDNPPTN